MNHLLQILLPGTSLTHKEIASSRSTPQPAAKHPQNPGSAPRVFKGKYPGIQWKFETPTCAGGSREGEAIPGWRRKSGTARSLRVGGSEGRVYLSPHSPLPLSRARPRALRAGRPPGRGRGRGSLPAAAPPREGRAGERRGRGWGGQRWAGCHTPGPLPALPPPTHLPSSSSSSSAPPGAASAPRQPPGRQDSTGMGGPALRGGGSLDPRWTPGSPQNALEGCCPPSASGTQRPLTAEAAPGAGGCASLRRPL